MDVLWNGMEGFEVKLLTGRGELGEENMFLRVVSARRAVVLPCYKCYL
jgi:hypothetical protein